MRKRGARIRTLRGHILRPDQVAALVTPIHVALELLPLGLYTIEHAHDLAAFLSVAQVAAEDARRPDIVEVGCEGAKVLLKMRDRAKAGKSWNVTNEEREALTRCVMTIDRWYRTQTNVRWRKALATVLVMADRAIAEGKEELDLIEQAA